MVKYKVRNTGTWKLDQPLDQPANWGNSSPVSGFFLYEVVETETNQVIKTDMTQSEAKSLCRHLNFGGGFDGFTPGFFLNKPGKLHFEEDYFYK
jgi:hypothetical protein